MGVCVCHGIEKNPTAETEIKHGTFRSIDNDLLLCQMIYFQREQSRAVQEYFLQLFYYKSAFYETQNITNNLYELPRSKISRTSLIDKRTGLRKKEGLRR